MKWLLGSIIGFCGLAIASGAVVFFVMRHRVLSEITGYRIRITDSSGATVGSGEIKFDPYIVHWGTAGHFPYFFCEAIGVERESTFQLGDALAKQVYFTGTAPSPKPAMIFAIAGQDRMTWIFYDYQKTGVQINVSPNTDVWRRVVPDNTLLGHASITRLDFK